MNFELEYFEGIARAQYSRAKVKADDSSRKQWQWADEV